MPMTYRQQNAIYNAQLFNMVLFLEHLAGPRYRCPSKTTPGQYYEVSWWTHHSHEAGDVVLFQCSCPAGKDHKFPCAHAAGLLLLTMRDAGIEAQLLSQPTKGGDEPHHEDQYLYLITELLIPDLVVQPQAQE